MLFQAKYKQPLASTILSYLCLSSAALAEIIENWQHLNSRLKKKQLRKLDNVLRPQGCHLFLPRGVLQAPAIQGGSLVSQMTQAMSLILFWMSAHDPGPFCGKVMFSLYKGLWDSLARPAASTQS